MLRVCSGLRRLPLTPWESNVVNRLQQPTHSYLARSRSAMSLSGEQTGDTHTSLTEGYPPTPSPTLTDTEGVHEYTKNYKSLLIVL